MSYFQPRRIDDGWRDERRSQRLLWRRQIARGGVIPSSPLPSNLYVRVRGTSIFVQVYVNLAKDALKNAWCVARDQCSAIGCDYEMYYQGLFRPRQSSFAMWDIQAGDTVELVPTSDPEWIRFKASHDLDKVYFRIFGGSSRMMPNRASYEAWARN